MADQNKSSALMCVEEARRIMRSKIKVLDQETISTLQANGRYLANDVFAQRTQPPCNVSAMDGYGVKFEGLNKGEQLHIIGSSAAGSPFEGVLANGQAVRIFTGAAMPQGADTVIIQEDVVVSNDSLEVTRSPKRLGDNVRLAGGDFSTGDQLLRAGVRIDAHCLGVIASGNNISVDVVRPPKISIISTGDELVTLGEEIGPSKIIATNEIAVGALIEDLGGEIISSQLVPDSLEQTINALNEAVNIGSDIIITSGGASVGDHDYLQEALTHIGAQIEVNKVAMRPGKPFKFSTLGSTLIASLPGNPVSSLICAKQFLEPLLTQIQGGYWTQRLFEGTLEDALPTNGDREHYMRCVVNFDEDGIWRIKLANSQDSSLNSTLALSNALIKRPPFDPAVQRNDTRKFLFL